jgi:chemotaxis protein methyltransferase CheR
MELLSRRISTEMALDYPPERWGDLLRGIRAALPDLGYKNGAPQSELDGIHALAMSRLSPAEIEVLATHLTIGETYFWREHHALAALETQVLPPMIEARRNSTRHLHIWCAACSSGEEPYSVAMLLHRLIPDIVDWHISIQATDINTDVLRKARAAVYGKWSFRGTPTDIQSAFFSKTDDGRHQPLLSIRQWCNSISAIWRAI